MRHIFTSLTLCAAISAAAQVTTSVDRFDYYGPFPVAAPLMIDSLDVNSKPYDASALLSQPLQNRATLPSGKSVNGPAAPGYSAAPALHVLAFTLENEAFDTPAIKVEGLKNYKLTVDGKDAPKELRLAPASHRVAIKYLSEPSRTVSVKVTLTSRTPVKITDGAKRLYGMNEVLDGTRISSVSISPDGRYLITCYSTTLPGGKTENEWRVTDAATGQLKASHRQPVAWLPVSSRYYITRTIPDGKTLYAVDPATGAETLFASAVPDGRLVIMPDEKRILVIGTAKGPKEDKDIYRILEPDDRQPGWRNRPTLSIYDIASGTMRPLTHGHRATRLLDVADDGSRVLLSVSESRLEKRPTTLSTILSVDLATLKADTIVARDGFTGGARFSPDATEILITGSPEALGGIGNVVPEGRIPSMTDNQLFLRRADGTFEPLTRDFNPSVSSVSWSRADGMIYFTAENRDCVSLYRLNPANGKITRIAVPEDLVKGFSLPRAGTTIAWTGQSASNPDRLYTLDTRRMKSTLLDGPLRDVMAQVRLGKCEPWTFVNSRGDSIWGRFYLPPDFDPARKYPMIVNYYGGCSPVERTFESRYPHHVYAAQGYVVLVLEPSGATGFGQEFSSRHVKTAGKGVAEDIIEGTKLFGRQHQYVDTTRIGCIGASYGGFMTQYLQTLTPMFAAAISHAGISDHTSYWGEGYWGYSYSEVSMGDAYPWSDPDLYVKQSPLFRADRITTPLLFLHGDSDHNVPPGESIQMFTALKLLGRPTAFVEVTGQDHHILDYDKRRKWQDTIFAWFAKYLKDQPEWWDALYPPVSL